MKRLLVLFVLVLCALGTYAQRGNIPIPRPRGLTDGFDVVSVTLDYTYDNSVGEFVFSVAGITGIDGGLEGSRFIIHDQERYFVQPDSLSPAFKTFAGRIKDEAFANYKARKGY